ncbi:hypothetical protein LPJ57_006164, partial [Coemansia sp. RSA 486]
LGPCRGLACHQLGRHRRGHPRRRQGQQHLHPGRGRPCQGRGVYPQLHCLAAQGPCQQQAQRGHYV